jgi:hypothetical protein
VWSERFPDPRTGATITRAIAHSGQLVISIDTAMGRHKTNSVVLATDKLTRSPIAALWSNSIRYDDLARAAQGVWHWYGPKGRSIVKCKSYPTIVVEDDGVGDATCLELDNLGVPYERFSQAHRFDGKTNQERCITATKRRVEAGLRHGAPEILREEVKRFVRDEKGDYQGPKDCIMTQGIALAHIDEHPFEHTIDPETVKDRAQRVYLEERLREDRIRDGVKRSPWG